jgi:hypothetical protein
MKVIVQCLAWASTHVVDLIRLFQRVVYAAQRQKRHLSVEVEIMCRGDDRVTRRSLLPLMRDTTSGISGLTWCLLTDPPLPPRLLSRTQRLGFYREYLLQRLREREDWAIHVMVDSDLTSYGTVEVWLSLLCERYDWMVASAYGWSGSTYGDLFAFRTPQYTIGPGTDARGEQHYWEEHIPWLRAHVVPAHRPKQMWYPVTCAFGWCTAYRRTHQFPHRVSYVSEDPTDVNECEHVILQRQLVYPVWIHMPLQVRHDSH